MTKPVAGAVRGRPAGTTKNLSADPDRYVIALFHAILSSDLFPANGKPAALKLAVAALIGRSVRPIPKARKPRSRVIPTDYVKGLSFEFEQGFGVVDKHTARVKSKITRYTAPEELEYLRKMTAIFGVAFFPDPNSTLDQRQASVTAMATIVGEGEYAATVLVPLMRLADCHEPSPN